MSLHNVQRVTKWKKRRIILTMTNMDKADKNLNHVCNIDDF